MITKRARRIRKNPAIRNMVRETSLAVNDLVQPIFVVEGEGIKHEIPSLTDIYHYSIDMLDEELKEISDLGIQAVIVFGLPNEKDEFGSQAYAEDGIVQNAISYIKKNYPELCVISDVCMCQYTSHGHCGIVTENGIVDNDETLKYLAKIAVSHAKAGADIVAPSDMMDGRVMAIRKALDEASYKDVGIMSYSAKYSSSLYGPFRDAAHSAPHFGDRKTYQMDPHNSREALKEMEYDVDEGADYLMVKPALLYLDVLREARNRFELPMVAYMVSGEYMMIKNAVRDGVFSEDVIYESVMSIKRAGADVIITYFAKLLARSFER